MRCILVGNYGAGNIGDEALREYFLQAFPDIEWVVVSASANRKGETTPRLPFGLRSLFKPWWRTLLAMKHADAVVFGGGTLFTDIESIKACRMWRRYADAARMQKKPYFMAFQGVGPFKTVDAETMTRSVFEHAAFVSVRDRESFDRVRSWNLKVPPVLTSDPAVALFDVHPKTVPAGRRLALIPRTNSGEPFFAEARKAARNAWDDVRILLMQPDAKEREVAERITRLVPSTVVAIGSVTQLLDEVGAASMVVTERYHGALAALSLGKETIIVSQAEGDKLAAIGKGTGNIDARIEEIRRGERELRRAFQTLGLRNSTS